MGGGRLASEIGVKWEVGLIDRGSGILRGEVVKQLMLPILEII